MKKFLLGSVAAAALGIGAPAIAADMGVRPAAPVRAFSWTGCHVGGLVGFEWGNQNGYTTSNASSVINTNPALSTFRAFNGAAVFAGQSYNDGGDLSGFNGGGYAGCDYQFGPIVVGFEGDWSNVNKSGQGNPSLSFLRSGLLTSAGTITGAAGGPLIEAQERWYATARGRVGYALDKWLFFVSGGAAWTKVDYSQSLLCGSTAGIGSFTASCGTAATGYSAQDSTRRSGWTVGAGVDYAPAVLHGNFIVRVEYLYVDYGNFNTFTAPFVLPTGSAASTNLYITNLSTRLNDHIIRFGLAYKFL
jgi:outer membrane immunogenic protein